MKTSPLPPLAPPLSFFFALSFAPLLSAEAFDVFNGRAAATNLR